MDDVGNFIAIWYTYFNGNWVSFFPFWNVVPRKIWQPCRPVQLLQQAGSQALNGGDVSAEARNFLAELSSRRNDVDTSGSYYVADYSGSAQRLRNEIWIPKKFRQLSSFWQFGIGQQFGQIQPQFGQSGLQLGQNLFGQNQLGQNQLGQNQLGQNQFGQNQFGQNQFGQNQQGLNQFGQNQLGLNQFGQNQQGLNQFGQNQPGLGQFSPSQFGQNQQLFGQPGQNFSPSAQNFQGQNFQGQNFQGQNLRQRRFVAANAADDASGKTLSRIPDPVGSFGKVSQLGSF
jgi:hypothetical protein